MLCQHTRKGVQIFMCLPDVRLAFPSSSRRYVVFRLCSGEYYDCGGCKRSVHGGSDEMYSQEVRFGTREFAYRGAGVVRLACFR